MAADWPLKSIAECAADEAYSTQIGPFGKALKADQYVESGVPVLRGANVNRGRFHDDDFVFVDSLTADRLAKFESFPGDVLLVHKGTLGEIGLMPKKRMYPRYIMGNSMMRVQCNPNVLLPEYLYYWLSSSNGQNYLFSRVSQVGVPQIQTPLTTLRQARLPVPPVVEQRSITHILSTLDDKIDLNRRMSETIEAMAWSLFRSWFVHFNPVRGGRAQYESDLPQHFWDLFPDRLVESDLGHTPEGWPVRPFTATVDVLSGGTPRTSVPEYWGGEIPWFSVVDAPSPAEMWVIDTEKHVTHLGIESSSTQVLPIGTTILSARGTVGRVALVAVPMAMNQSCYALRGKQGSKGLFNYYSTRNLVGTLKQHAHGSVFDTITRNTLDRVSVVVPPSRLVDEFERLVAPLANRILLNRFQSRTLATLRDTLLPKLISGELRIKDAERLVSEVV